MTGEGGVLVTWGQGETWGRHVQWALANVPMLCGGQWDLPWDARNLELEITIKVSICFMCWHFLGKLMMHLTLCRDWWGVRGAKESVATWVMGMVPNEGEKGTGPSHCAT